MRRFYKYLVLFLCLAGERPLLAELTPDQYEKASTEVLESERREIEAELEGLAALTMRMGLGTRGFVSKELGEEEVSLDLFLGGERSFDRIVLVPSIWRIGKADFQSDRFPDEFRLLVGSGDEAGRVLASFTKADGLFGRVAPVVIDCPGARGEWVRLEVVNIPPSLWNGQRYLQISEWLVFDGEKNIALGQTVRTKPENLGLLDSSLKHVVDGQVPYVMASSGGESSLAFLSDLDIRVGAEMTIDLEQEHRLDWLAVHRVDLEDTVPQTEVSDFGLPRRMEVIGSLDADFANPVRLGEMVIKSIFDAGPVVWVPLQGTPVRYVKFKLLKPYDRIQSINYAGRRQFGSSEIQLFSEGANVARGHRVSAEFKGWGPDRKLVSLTDGENIYGEILSVRDWMEQLARREYFNNALPVLNAVLSERYVKQRRMMNSLKWLLGLVTVVGLLSFFMVRLKRVRELGRLRERLAADLHDDLGANLFAIGLLSDVAARSLDGKLDRLPDVLRRIRSESERSGEAVTRCSKLLVKDNKYSGLLGDMERSCRRIAGQATYEFQTENRGEIETFCGAALHDVYLFHKECLVNIGRHAEASFFKTEIGLEGAELVLRVEDNGVGIQQGESRPASSSLERRANLLKGALRVMISESGGTVVELRVKRSLFKK